MEGQKIVLNRRAFVAGGAVAAASLGSAWSAAVAAPPRRPLLRAAPRARCRKKARPAAGTLTAAVGYQTNNYHPSTTSSALALGANWHVVEGLYELNMATYEPYAALAAGDPVEVSETQYEVTLREGAKFSDGTEVTAADVVSSWNRATAEGGLYVPMLSWIANIEAKDDTTVTITTAFPFSLVKERLSLIKVVPTSATDEQLTSQPVGTARGCTSPSASSRSSSPRTRSTTAIILPPTSPWSGTSSWTTPPAARPSRKAPSCAWRTARPT